MYEATFRDAAGRERLARSLASYYYRRALGVVCFDPRPPEVRAQCDAALRRKRVLARHTLNKLLATGCGRGAGAPTPLRASNVIPLNRRQGPSSEAPEPRGRPDPVVAPQALVSSISSTATGLPL